MQRMAKMKVLAAPAFVAEGRSVGTPLPSAIAFTSELPDYDDRQAGPSRVRDMVSHQFMAGAAGKSGAGAHCRLNTLATPNPPRPAILAPSWGVRL